MTFTQNEENEESSRLDLFLLLRNNDLSRNFIATSIKKGYVKVNNDVILKPSHKIRNGFVVSYDVDSAKRAILEDDYEHVMAQDIDLNIIFEDEDLLVINKSSGMATHPSSGHSEYTLLNGVHGHLHDSNKDILPSRKHMVHRLDKDTSGIIVFAKTDKMLWWLHRQFAERRVNKEYYALSFSPKKYDLNELIHLEGYIERSKREKRVYMFSNKYGKWTVTDFTVCKNLKAINGKFNQGLLLVNCKPRTGRTHQLRVHLKSLNLPIWGDVLYSSDKQLKFAKEYCNVKKQSLRLFLHAYKLEFTSYNGKEYKFQIELPEELKSLINTFNEI
jgi:23S rRNA pseudouridine1911/1915/1917 synthase